MEIELTRGLVTQVDEEFGFLNQYKWFANETINKKSVQYYATRKISYGGVALHIRMHRVIMEYKLGRILLRSEQIDHIDHDGLNNTCNNLRISTHQQNNINSRKRNTITSSQYLGVTWYKRNSKWLAQIGKDGKNKNLGYFTNEEDAARARDAAAKLYFGEYANLNFTEKQEC